MKYQELCAISGLSGLYHLLATKSDGAIVRNLDDNTTKFVAARSHNVTPLDSIEVYTNEDNVRLWEVFMNIKKNASHLDGFDIAKADNKAIKAMFLKLFPEHDQQRVYPNDMKKMIKWFGILTKLDLLHEEVVEENPAEEKTEK